MQTEIVTPENIEAYLEQHQTKELLRFVTVGSVDDGKSTLIGRLLHDTHGVYEDQLSAVKQASSQRGAIDEEIDFSLFTDGLKAEREQGITIDVAYRYFSTERRKFIIADTPGHEQYTRNMATGASTANVGIILIDARLGVQRQSRRHAYIASLLGIPRLLVAVNKMDLREFQQQVFDDIVRDFSEFAKGLSFKEVKFIPISAKLGDNVVHPSKRMPWARQETLLEYLETVPVAGDRNVENFRFPVQNVIRPNLDYRGFAGEVASGVIKKGDTVMVLPSRKTSKVRSIDTFDGELDEAYPPMAVTLRLADEIDISRGDMLVHPKDLPSVGNRFRAHVVWMSETPLDRGKSYLMKHTTHIGRANVEAIDSVMDLKTLTSQPAEGMGLNDIGLLRISSHRPIFFDPYDTNRSTGAFILIDSITNNTVAAGMIVEASGPPSSKDAVEGGALGKSQVSSTERALVAKQRGALVAVSGDGADDFAYQLERAIYDRARLSCVLDPDTVGAGDIGALVEHLVRVGIVTIAVTEDDALARRMAGERGKSAVLPVRVGAEAVTIAGQDVPSTKSQWEKAAARVVDELEERGLFVE